MAGFDNDVVYGINVDFTGTSPVSGQVNLDGELLVGATTVPFIRSYIPTGSNGLVVNTGPGTIDFSLANIPNSALTNSSITVTAGTGLSGGGFISLGGSTSINLAVPVTVPNGGTGAITLTNHGVLIGQGTSAIIAATPSATSGVPVISQGAAADPVFGTAVVAGGGTGNTTFTAFSVIAAGTTATGAFQNVSGLGSSGQALVSAGAGVLPAWGTVGVNGGGTGLATLTIHALYVGNGTTAPTALAVGATGTLLVGATTADPAFATSAVGDFTFTSAVAGGTRLFTVSNSDNTNAASNATIKALTGGASAGDPRYSASTTTTEWSWGVDNSVTSPGADPFVISQGAVLGTNNIMSVKTTGEINYPLQTSFQARATLQSNVTGDATTYTLTFTTAIFDQNSDFDGTSTFTAPVTGKYFLCCALSIGGVLSTHTTGTFSIVTTTRTYNYTYDPAKTFDVNTNVSAIITCLTDMTAADTAVCKIQVSNGTKVVDINTATNTYFCGFLQA